MIQLFPWYFVNDIEHINYIKMVQEVQPNRIVCYVYDIKGNKDRHITWDKEPYKMNLDGFSVIHGNSIRADDNTIDVIDNRQKAKFLINKSNITYIKLGETFDFTTVDILFNNGHKLELWGDINDYYRWSKDRIPETII